MEKLTDYDRFRSEGYIKIFVDTMPRFKQSGDEITYLELITEGAPELRVMRCKVNAIVKPENIIGSACVVGVEGNEYKIFSTGMLTGCSLLSSAINRIKNEVFK